MFFRYRSLSWVAAWLLLLTLSPYAAAAEGEEGVQDSAPPRFAYQQREFTLEARLKQLGLVYGASWIVYPISQPEILEGKLGSWSEYGNNFGKLTFDLDEPQWNVLVHPISGSQLYLFYRAVGHDRRNSFLMAFISSALFEFTIEIYSEPASIQDLYQTPVIGTALGYGLEVVSTHLLNQPSTIARFAGRLINPLSLLVDSEAISLTPIVMPGSQYGLKYAMGF